MNPAGIIITFMDLRKWKTWWFNIPLFLFQLTFMVVGTILGKVRIPHIEDPWEGSTFSPMGDKSGKKRYVLNFNEETCTITYGGWLRYHRLQFCYFWRCVWKAAQASHVRLVLEKVRIKVRREEIDSSRQYWKAGSDYYIDEWLTANFGYPKMKIQPWFEQWNDGKRFEYREPTFKLPQEAIDEMIHYAEGEVGKPYDKLQLLSPVINFGLWITWWPSWGQEIIKWSNQPGGAEFCSSGITACLRWAAKYIHPDELLFFFDYSTAMVMPCMFMISEKWRKVE